MQQEYVWPKYKGLVDNGSTVTFQMEGSNGEMKSVEVDKRFQGGTKELTEEQYRTILFRPFDTGSSQSLVIKLPGAIGDSIIAFETILSLQEFLKKKSSRPFEYVARHKEARRLEFLARFLEISSIFDKAALETEIDALTTQFPVLHLSARPHEVRVECYSFGSMWDVLWGKWGLPGGFPGIVHPDYFARVTRAAEKEFSLNRGTPGFPQRSGYILLCPDGKESHKKMWPLENWRVVLTELIRDTDHDLVVLTSNALQQATLSVGRRVTIYDYARDKSNDFLRLVSLVHGARAVLSLDSGPAHVAGHLSKLCVVLWGSSNPTYFGHRNNINVRLSACPPCLATPRRKLCPDNICIQAIRPHDIVEYLKQLIRNTLSS